jgi:peptidoglycan/xylan/chitin deacetylase (PgdA/CDA1 family)
MTPYLVALVAGLSLLALSRIRRHYIKNRWGGEPSPGIRSVSTTKKVCALTFDDGPDPRTTPIILDVLKKHGVHASFFVVGSKVLKHADLIRRIHQEGHDLGNHTYSHARISFCSKKKMLREIEATQQALLKVVPSLCNFFRPPHGRFMGEQKEILETHTHLKTIMWDVCPNDWTLTSTEPLLANIRGELKPGSIILLHDVISNTAHSIEALIQSLQQDGYQCLSVSELLQHGHDA